jgi:hypothetical protein
MRHLGIEVDCAADISEARCWWRPDLYDLVLFHVESELPQMHKFWDDIRAATPSQRTAFLVGKPEYLAASPNGEAHGQPEELDATVPPDAASGSTHSLPEAGHWGILEACRRISAVRSVAEARVRALRNKPLPPRDSTDPEPRRAAELEINAVLDREDTR